MKIIGKSLSRLLYMFVRRKMRKDICPELEKITKEIVRLRIEEPIEIAVMRRGNDFQKDNIFDDVLIPDEESLKDFLNKETFCLLIIQSNGYVIDVSREWNPVLLQRFYEDHQDEIERLIDYYKMMCY